MGTPESELTIAGVRNESVAAASLNIGRRLIVLKKNESTLAKPSALKRAFDILFSLVFCVAVLSWLLPLLALLIKLESKGPVFFRQKRTGLLNREFWCIKLRTMQNNDEADEKQASHIDERITRLGHFLRNTNLDELPQFINVLKGDMSVVGPRPHMLKHTQEFGAKIQNYDVRHWVRPGLTGLAQIKGWRGPTPTPRSIYKRVQWDIYYVHHQSFALDLYIISCTVKEVLVNFCKQLFT